MSGGPKVERGVPKAPSKLERLFWQLLLFRPVLAIVLGGAALWLELVLEGWP